MTDPAPSLPIPFALGETVWRATFGTVAREVECPECAGTCALTLVKGNGETVSLECNNCQSGYDAPRGWVKAESFEAKVEPFTCRRITSYGENDIHYSESSPGAACYSSCDAKYLFRDRAEAQALAEKMAAEHLVERERCAVANLASRRRSLSHSTHYWKSQVTRLEHELETARARLAVCPKKKREPAPAPVADGGIL